MANHINFEERKIIERLLKQNTPKKQIARLLNRNISTIRREIKKGSVEQRKKIKTNSKRIDIPLYKTDFVYYAETAQRVYKKNRDNCGAKRKLCSCSELVTFVEESFRTKHWSLDASNGYAQEHNLFNEKITTRTLYNWIDLGLLNIKNIDLPLKLRRKTHNKIVRQHKRLYGMSIDDRPVEINERIEFGHWEGDGIVGKNKKGHLITLVERKTGMGFLFNVKDRKATRIVEVLDHLEQQFGTLFSNVFKTITFDNGIEFADCLQMQKRNRTKIYYAHPYSSWERGTNENWNGIVRRFIPKKSSFDNLSDDKIKRIQNFINNLPRRRFNYKCPEDLFVIELQKIILKKVS